MQLVSREAGLEAFLADRPERLAETVDHRGRRRVVVEAPGAPVVGELAEVQIVAPHFGPAPADDGVGPRVVGDRRQPRRTAQTLLGPCGRDVDVPAVDGDLAPAQGHHAVRDQERAVVVGRPCEVGERLEYPGRGLAVNDRDQLRLSSFQRSLDGGWIDQSPPLAAHHGDLGATPLGDLDQQQAEAPALGDDHPVARLDQRGERRFETCAPRAGHGEGARVGGLECKAREVHDVVHDRGELRVELAQERRRHRAQDARVGHGRTRAQEDPRTGEEIAGGHAREL